MKKVVDLRKIQRWGDVIIPALEPTAGVTSAKDATLIMCVPKWNVKAKYSEGPFVASFRFPSLYWL